MSSPLKKIDKEVYVNILYYTFQRSESAASLRQREKSYYYDARETHYNRFGPHAWFDPGMRGRTHRQTTGVTIYSHT